MEKKTHHVEKMIGLEIIHKKKKDILFKKHLKYWYKYFGHFITCF